eukprot:GCRY01006365.1.p1 GENE.GCRY01006365.1~~GCRY01006365.1.p1  ORF type:complete len:333 (+),score=51.53 GCRY01006365.1:136-1134(+)
MDVDNKTSVIVPKEKFNSVLSLWALKVKAADCNAVVRKHRVKQTDAASQVLFVRPRMRTIVEDTDDSTRLILLSEKVASAELTEIPENIRTELLSVAIDVVPYELKIDYSYYNADEVLHTLLPEIEEIPTSFETVGHLAHVNLRSELLPHKFLIGQVLLDKNERIRTVVNKIDSIENEFRVFPMEVIAGDSDMNVEVKESSCRFQFDYSKVYWNSRLQMEHNRTVKLFKKNEIIWDMTAGIGPFAVPAGKKGCCVHANDLNPESYKYLLHNIQLNKVKKNVHAYNMDARDFVVDLASKSLPAGSPFHHAIINLPALGIELMGLSERNRMRNG